MQINDDLFIHNWATAVTFS